MGCPEKHGASCFFVLKPSSRLEFVNDGKIAAMAAFLSELPRIRGVRLLPYHNYAASKYEALQMLATLPARLPSEEALENARTMLRSAGLRVIQ